MIIILKCFLSLGPFFLSLKPGQTEVPFETRYTVDPTLLQKTDLTDLELFARFCLPVCDRWDDVLWLSITYLGNSST